MTAAFWNTVDRAFVALASVKITVVVLIALTVLAVPGTSIMQVNISNVDPGIMYDYDFWKWGQALQLFTSYHSFWYVGLMVLLSMNLIACSVIRWPQMLKLAIAEPVAWSEETFKQQPANMVHEFSHKESDADRALDLTANVLREKLGVKAQVIQKGSGEFQLFWQSGRWSRIANYLVHTSLLVIFAGAIVGAMYGFEGAANIPSGAAVDTLLLFKEGKASGLQSAPGGLKNEKLFGFRVQAEQFAVSFYPDWPGRPQEFMTKLNFIENGSVVDSATIRVNEPHEYKGFTFYQASYGKMGDFLLQYRIVDRQDPSRQSRVSSKLNEPQPLGGAGTGVLVPVQAVLDLQSMGPGVQFQQFVNNQPLGKPFWVLKDFPDFDWTSRKESSFGVILDSVEEHYFTGLQIGHDPGAPIYWIGAVGMLLGTFYALFVTHRKHYLLYRNGKVLFSASIHRLPFGFESEVRRIAKVLESSLAKARS